MKRRKNMMALIHRLMSALFNGVKRDKALMALVSLITVIILAGRSYAGTTGTEFQAAYTLISGWSTGYLGRIIALATFLVGLAGTIIRQSLIPVVIGLAVAITVALGPAIIEAIATAVF